MVLNATLDQLNDLMQETRSTLHIATSLEVLINNQFFQLNVLRKISNGFYQLLNGHLSPDLVGFKKIESVFNGLKSKAEKHGLALVAEHPAELYQYDSKFISYHNTSTRDLVLVVYITPHVFRPGAAFTLKQITFLPISWEGVTSVVTLNEGRPMYIAQNPQNSLSQVLPNIDDCKNNKNFYSCPNLSLIHI